MAADVRSGGGGRQHPEKGKTEVDTVLWKKR